MDSLPQNKSIPKIVVFDLDACCWDPDLYYINGTPPFEYDKTTGVVTNSAKTRITLCSGVVEAWNEIMTSPLFEKTSIAIASRCWYIFFIITICYFIILIFFHFFFLEFFSF